jgi:asparagine synthase (glutamine-hydrolysing)
MSLQLLHRGPDQDGDFADSRTGVYFAHRRLSIIDLSEMGRQPMTSACGRFVVVYNGEIYNHVELRKTLTDLGCVFRSGSDTEVLLHAYAQWGKDCLSRFNGMFAFALYDIPAGKVFLARDRIGEKPLYYIHRPDLFAFASEVKAFRPLKKLGFEFKLDAQQVAGFLGYMWVPDRSGTLLKDVRRLEPGQWGEYDLATRQFRVQRYWDLQIKEDVSRLRFDEAVERYEHLLDESVRIRLRADVPVAVMLSGGLDSSIIAALARKHVTDLRTYTLVFKRANSEGPFADIVARHIGSRHHELLIDTADVLKTIKDAVPFFDDLTTVDGGLVTTYAMCGLLKEQGVKVILLGEGSDEVNAGYSKFLFSKFPFTWVPSIVRNAGFYYTLSRYSIFRDGFWRHAGAVDAIAKSFRGDHLQQMTGYDIQHQLPNHLLMKVDKATMAQSVEARVPFLDPNLVEFVYSLPAEYKYKGKWFNPWALNEKYILRQVAAQHLPASIIARRKFGMMLPTGEVLADNISEIREELLGDADSPIHAFIDRKEIGKLFDPPRWPWEKVEKDWFLWKVYLLHLWSQWILRDN